MKELLLTDEVQEIKINGEKYYVDMDDAEITGHFEKLRCGVLELNSKIKEDNAQEVMKEFCSLSEDAAEDILGAGSIKKVFGKTGSFKKCVAFSNFMLEVYNEHWNERKQEFAQMKADKDAAV